jgi:FSR family fosmidomycin resistance protein-like MFS transporter
MNGPLSPSGPESQTHTPPARDDRGRFHTADVVTIAAGHAVHDTFTGFLPPLLPLLIKKFMLTKTAAGLLSVFIQAPSLLQPFIGHRADRANLRLAVVLAPGVTAAAMSMLGLAPGYGTLTVMLLVAGASSAALHAVAPVVAGRLAGPGWGRAMGLWMVGGEAGRTLGPIVIVTAVAALTLKGTAVLMVVGIVTSAVLFTRLRHVSTRRSGSRAPLEWRSAVRAMRPVMAPLVAVTIARAFAVASFAVFLPTFLTEGGSSLWFAGASLSILEGAGVVGALTGGWISDRLGRRRVLAAGLLVTPAIAIVFLLSEGWLRYPLLVVLGFSLFSIMPAVLALVQESFPDNRSLANGVYMAMNFLIRSVAIVTVGAIGDAYGLPVAFAVAAVLMVAGLPFVFLLPGSPGGPGKPDPANSR